MPPPVRDHTPGGLLRKRPHGQRTLHLVFESVHGWVVAGPFHAWLQVRGQALAIAPRTCRDGGEAGLLEQNP